MIRSNIIDCLGCNNSNILCSSLKILKYVFTPKYLSDSEKEYSIRLIFPRIVVLATHIQTFKEARSLINHFLKFPNSFSISIEFFYKHIQQLDAYIEIIDQKEFLEHLFNTKELRFIVNLASKYKLKNLLTISQQFLTERQMNYLTKLQQNLSSKNVSTQTTIQPESLFSKKRNLEDASSSSSSPKSHIQIRKKIRRGS